MLPPVPGMSSAMTGNLLSRVKLRVHLRFQTFPDVQLPRDLEEEENQRGPSSFLSNSQDFAGRQETAMETMFPDTHIPRG